jgi:hypothetical protein
MLYLLRPNFRIWAGSISKKSLSVKDNNPLQRTSTSIPLPENWTVVELPFARPQRRLTWAQAL